MRTAIGIDIGGTNIRAALISEGGDILRHESRPTVRYADAVMADIDRLTQELRQPSCVAIGIGIPGRVDAASGQVHSGGYVDLSSAGVQKHVEAATGLATFADNDGNMAMLAEARKGAARSVSNTVMLTIGTGVGGGILSKSKIFHGGGTAGQLGHITVRLDGHLCTCGRLGCLETESSGTSLKRHMAEAGLPITTDISEILRSETPAARQVLTNWAVPLRAGIDSLIAALAPDLVVLGGGLGAAAAEALQRVPVASPWFQCRIVAAELGDEAGVIGAGLAALEHSA